MFYSALTYHALALTVQAWLPNVMPTISTTPMTKEKYLEFLRFSSCLNPFDALVFAVARAMVIFPGKDVEIVVGKALVAKHRLRACVGVGGFYDCPVCLREAGRYIFKPESPPPASSSASSTTSPDSSASSSGPRPRVFRPVPCMWDGGVCGDVIDVEDWTNDEILCHLRERHELGEDRIGKAGLTCKWVKGNKTCNTTLMARNMRHHLRRNPKKH